MAKRKVDALVIGSGVGGLCAAARLAAEGLKVSVVERLAALGGRCSTRGIRGCKVTTGAIMVPFGERSAFHETFRLMGATFNVREGKGGFRYRLRHGEYDAPTEGGGGLLGMLKFAMGEAAAAESLLVHFKRALSGREPSDMISFEAWLSQHTSHPEVHNLLRGFCAAFIGTSLNEVPAGEYFRFLKAMGRNNRYGIAVNGNVELMNSLAGSIEEKGGTVNRRTACKCILVEKGRVRGAVVEGAGLEETIEADFVISNAGPKKTVELGGEENFDKSYLSLLRKHPFETPVIHVCIFSEEPLHPFPGILNFGNTRRLIFLECPTLTCPELAPPGVHITTTFSVPESSVPPMRRKRTIEEIMGDLEENFPSFNRKEQKAMVTTHQGEWPSMRRWPGYPMPTKTPIENLYNVGDGCMPPGTVGIEASALSAKSVAGQILSGR
jgi:phytoene dehydrogenase-like protein